MTGPAFERQNKESRSRWSGGLGKVRGGRAQRVGPVSPILLWWLRTDDVVAMLIRDETLAKFGEFGW